MYYNNVDDKLYQSPEDFPYYGGCKLLESKDGRKVLFNCEDITAAPTNITVGSICVDVAGASYCLTRTETGNEWVPLA